MPSKLDEEATLPGLAGHEDLAGTMRYPRFTLLAVIGRAASASDAQGLLANL